LPQARGRMVEEIASLPRRSFFFWLRDSPHGPQRLTSPRLDAAALVRSAEALSTEQRERIRLGSASIVRVVPPDPDPPDSVAVPDPRVAPLRPDKRRRTPRLG